MSKTTSNKCRFNFGIITASHLHSETGDAPSNEYHRSDRIGSTSGMSEKNVDRIQSFKTSYFVTRFFLKEKELSENETSLTSNILPNFGFGYAISILILFVFNDNADSIPRIP